MQESVNKVTQVMVPQLGKLDRERLHYRGGSPAWDKKKGIKIIHTGF